MLKVMFSYFGEFQVLYKHPNYFKNVEGSYTVLLNHKFNKITKEQINFISLLNRIAIDFSSYPKIVAVIEAGKIRL